MDADTATKQIYAAIGKTFPLILTTDKVTGNVLTASFLTIWKEGTVTQDSTTKALIPATYTTKQITSTDIAALQSWAQTNGCTVGNTPNTITVRMFIDQTSTPQTANVNYSVNGCPASGTTPLTVYVNDKDQYSFTVAAPAGYNFKIWGTGTETWRLNPTRSGAYDITSGAVSFTAYSAIPTKYEGMYVPLYNWNCAGYDTIIAQKQANPTLPIVVAINPASGPGTSKSTAIANAVTAMQQAGITVIGYVGTNYGSELTKAQYPVGNPWPSNTPNTLTDVEARCLNYVQWYGVTGFMFDDYSNTQFITMPDGTQKDVYNTFYTPLTTYARSLTGITKLKGNMGTKPLYTPLVDQLDLVCIYEGVSQPSTTTMANNSLNSALADKAVIVCHDLATLDTTQFKTMASYARYFYASDGTYNQLPTYFSSLVSGLASTTA